MVKLKDITLLTSKFVKTPKKCAIIDHMLLYGHKASFNDFSTPLTENNNAKLQIKKSSHDKTLLNKDIYSFPLELVDGL